MTPIVLLWLQFTPELRQHVEAGLQAKTAGNFAVAEQEFRRVAELAPKLPAAHVNLGAVYLETKDYANAAKSLRAALALDPNLPGAEGMLGAALLAQGFAGNAIPHLEKAEMHDLLGVALLESDHPREAVDHLETALLKRPGDPDLLYYLSHAYGALSQNLFDQLRQRGEGTARVQQMLGESAAASGNGDAAERHFRAALQYRKDLRGVHYAIGELHLKAAAYDKAETEFRLEKELSPGSAATAYKLGSVLLNRGNIKAAVSELKRSDSLQPDMPETLAEFGKALHTAGDAAGAAACFERALRLEKTGELAGRLHFQLAQVYRKIGRASDAAREIRAFQEIHKQRER